MTRRGLLTSIAALIVAPVRSLKACFAPEVHACSTACPEHAELIQRLVQALIDAGWTVIQQDDDTVTLGSETSEMGFTTCFRLNRAFDLTDARWVVTPYSFVLWRTGTDSKSFNGIGNMLIGQPSSGEVQYVNEKRFTNLSLHPK